MSSRLAPRAVPLLMERVALVAAVLGALSSACASAAPRGAPVSGLFDDGGDDRGGGGGGAGMATEAYRGDAARQDDGEAGKLARVTVANTESAPAPRGLFDFNGDEVSGDLKKEAMPARPRPAPPPALPSTGAPSTGTAADKTEQKSEEASGPRLVIYQGSLTVLVPLVDDAVKKLSARAKELGGYVENQTANTGSNSATVTLRVPAEKFYDLVGELGGYGQVTQKQISAEDVTKKVFDVELRLETAEKSRERLLDLLKTATKMEEILQIETQVRRLTDEIEGMKGELRFLKDQVALSTLAVTFYANAPAPTALHARVRSRFDWINAVGIEPVMAGF